jgi:hypothetical protein
LDLSRLSDLFYLSRRWDLFLEDPFLLLGLSDLSALWDLMDLSTLSTLSDQ